MLVAEPGAGQEKSIPMSAGTAQAIDPLVTAIWEQMDAWGMAGKGMYWRPVLSVYVAPGAEQRFEDLNRLLRGSGLIIQKETELKPMTRTASPKPKPSTPIRSWTSSPAS